MYAVYIYYVYINTQTCMYIFKKIGYFYIWNIFIYNVCHITLYVNIFLNIYCMSVYLYIHNKYTQYTYFGCD